MIILGINSAHNATACLLKDGQILACVSEERLTRIKNQYGMPYLSIAECLKIARIKKEDVDYLVLNHKDPKVHIGFTTFVGDKNRDVKVALPNLSQKILSFFWHIKEFFLIEFPISRVLIDQVLNLSYKVFVNPKARNTLYKDIKKKLGLPKQKILFADHHLSHGLAAYFCSPFPKNKPILILTADSSGDNICATVNIGKGEKIKRVATSSSGSAIGDLYMQTTAFLGMKPHEHEYKVMGLAPYSNPTYYQSILDKLRRLIWVNPDLTFGSRIHSHMFYKILPKLFAYERFDNIAGALQKLTEDLLSHWVSLAVKKTHVPDVVCGGGVFMNVKANQLISQINEVKSLFVMPSASDESTAIGAAFWAYQQQRLKNPSLPEITPIDNLYLGGDFSEANIKHILKKPGFKKFKTEKPKNIESKVAKLLSEGKIVARFKGKMEWGARALGNRSILAHPGKLEVISEINDQIKSRDFWMPFAPSILEEDKDKYFVNKKDIAAPYMITTFQSTKEGRHKLKAAMHQYDHTLRPQIIYRDWNPTYYELIKEFKKITGIGAVLNTSFNLHGFPIVYTPEDALDVFEKSKLKFLALGPFLVSKA